MVEATSEDAMEHEDGGNEPERSRRFPYDQSLLSALVDRWRPETHTFPMPFGEMTVTIQDVTMLTGLPLHGAPLGPSVTDPGWRDDFLHHFEGVVAGAGVGIGPSKKHGPPLQWLKQYRVRNCIYCVLFFLFQSCILIYF